MLQPATVAEVPKRSVGVKIKHAIYAGGVSCNPGEVVHLREDIANHVVSRGYGEFARRPVPIPSAPIKTEVQSGPPRDDKQVKDRIVK